MWLRTCVLLTFGLLLIPPQVFAVDLTKIERVIVKEPAYQGKPRYCLLVLGLKAERRIWIIQDGNTLYADCNSNGDLTEADERFEQKGPLKGALPNDPIKVGWLLPVVWPKESQIKQGLYVVATGQDGMLGAILFTDRRMWEDYGLKPEFAINQQAWCGLTPSDMPARAPMVHLAGPLTFAHEEANYDMKASLSRTGPQELRVNIGTPGLGTRTFAWIQFEALPKEIHPIAEIEFPAKGDGKPIRVTCVLDKRC
jgi:hypothetical protein